MASIISARAWANNEVAYVAWDIDEKIEGCLGFEITRVYLDENGKAALREDGQEDRVKCASWVAFKGQRNTLWLPQDTGVWPVQKLSWRDLTLRKRRNKMKRRPDEVFVRYEIRPVGDAAPGRKPILSNGLETAWVVKKDRKGKPVMGEDGKPVMEEVEAYAGKPRPLAYLDEPAVTNDIRVTRKRGCFQSTFTNGILAAQWLRNVLNEDGVIEKNELYEKIINPKDPHRKYLAGDVIPLIRDFFRQDGEFYLALYELEDQELEDLLVKNADRIHIILANTGLSKKRWDARNAPARERLVQAGVDIVHRMFNNATHIGHNKFVVHVPPGNGPRSVLTGSTNWTSTGLTGQTNNAIVVENDEIAGMFLDCWNRLKDDELKLPEPLYAPMTDNQQGPDLREENASLREV
ncbi:MAG: phospholipase D-like domain-containing protein, partial [Thermodesulfobacteriota bacterium]